jgi:hypothetical protein
MLSITYYCQRNRLAVSITVSYCYHDKLQKIAASTTVSSRTEDWRQKLLLFEVYRLYAPFILSHCRFTGQEMKVLV